MKIKRGIQIFPPAIAIALYLIGPVIFSRVYTEAIVWFVILVAILAISAFFGEKSVTYDVFPPAKSGDDIVIGYFKFMALPILAGAVYYVNWLYSQGTSIDMVVLNTGQVREITSGSDLSKQIAAIMAYQAYAYIPILLSNWRHRFPLRINTIMAVAVALMALAVVLQAGRTFFLVGAVLAAAVYVVSPKVPKDAAAQQKKWHSSILLYCGAGIVAIVGGMTIFVIGVQRVSSEEIAIVLHTAEYRYFGDWFATNSPTVAYFSTVVFHYLVGPWSNLNIAIVAETDFARWSYGPFEAIFSRFSEGYDPGYSGSALDSYKRYLMLGGQPTGWRTGYGNVLQWYGFLGFVIYAIFIGFFTGRLMCRASNSKSLVAFLKAVWAVAFFLMCLFYFPSDTIFWVNLTLVFAVLPMLISVLTPRRRQSKARGH
jgi:hypothetical protein